MRLVWRINKPFLNSDAASIGPHYFSQFEAVGTWDRADSHHGQSARIRLPRGVAELVRNQRGTRNSAPQVPKEIHIF